MAPERQGLLPREGIHLHHIVKLVSKTLLNPTLTLPLYLLGTYTSQGQAFTRDHPLLASRLKVLLGIGAAKVVNNYLNRGAQNNWTSAKPEWSNELVVITGGSDGMGRLLVEKFENRGVKVVVLDIQPIMGATGPNVHYIHCDLSSLEAINTAAEEVKSQHGDPTVLILNAGIINRHSILNTPDHLLRRVFDINTLSHYRLLKHFLPSMVSRNHGLISTTASLAGFATCPGMVDYCGTKAAAVAFHEGLTSELVTRYNAPKVRTLCICPNFVHTKLAEGFKNKSTFLNPTLYPETVVEAQFDAIWRWEGGIMAVPSLQANIACMLRSFPMWLQINTRNQLKEVMMGVEKIEQDRVKRLAAEKESESVVDLKKEEVFGLKA